jgi:hypothetical protein
VSKDRCRIWCCGVWKLDTCAPLSNATPVLRSGIPPYRLRRVLSIAQYLLNVYTIRKFVEQKKFDCVILEMHPCFDAVLAATLGGDRDLGVAGNLSSTNLAASLSQPRPILSNPVSQQTLARSASLRDTSSCRSLLTDGWYPTKVKCLPGRCACNH